MISNVVAVSTINLLSMASAKKIEIFRIVGLQEFFMLLHL